MLIRISLNANEKMLVDNSDADNVILMLILMLLNLNTGYADVNTDLCIRITFLKCYSKLKQYIKSCEHRSFIFLKIKQFNDRKLPQNDRVTQTGVLDLHIL